MNLQISSSGAAVLPSPACCEPTAAAVPTVEPRARPDGALIALAAMLVGWGLLAAGTLAALGNLAALPLAGN